MVMELNYYTFKFCPWLMYMFPIRLFESQYIVLDPYCFWGETPLAY